jgi:hypothetical protein
MAKGLKDDEREFLAHCQRQHGKLEVPWRAR